MFCQDSKYSCLYCWGLPVSVGVYTIRLFGADGVYVGSTVHHTKRWAQHRRELRLGAHCNVKLQKAYQKLGADALRFTLIEECDNGQLKAREEHWMTELQAHYRDGGFNIEKTARALDEIARARIAKTGRERTMTPEHCAAISAGRKGMKFSSSHCAAIRLAKTGAPYAPRSEESKRRSSEAITQWHARAGHTPEAKRKIAESLRSYQLKLRAGANQ